MSTSGHRIKWGDTGPFAVIPATVLDAGISDRAVRLYANLARRAGGPDEGTVRGHAEMEGWLQCKRTALKAALEELRAIGAVTVEEGKSPVGGRGWNTYIVHADVASATVDSRQGDHTPDAGATEQEVEPTTEKTETPKGVPVSTTAAPAVRAIGSVDRRPVTPNEATLAWAIIEVWNERTGQNLRALTWVRKIVMRIREHPELGLPEHEHVIECSLERPWWKGEPSPSVIYGNDAQFERQLVDAAKGAAPASQRAFDIALAAIQEERRAS